MSDTELLKKSKKQIVLTNDEKELLQLIRSSSDASQAMKQTQNTIYQIERKRTFSQSSFLPASTSYIP